MSDGHLWLEEGVLTIPNSVPILLAVGARYLGFVAHVFNLLLGAALGDVADLLAVAAKWFTIAHDIAGILKTSENLVAVLGPAFDLTGPVRLLRESVADRVFLAHVTLPIHVGEGLEKRSLDRDEPKIDALVNEDLLKILVCDLCVDSLDILLDTFFGIVDVPLSHGLLDLAHGLVSRDVGDMVTVDLSSILARPLHVA